MERADDEDLHPIRRSALRGCVSIDATERRWKALSGHADRHFFALAAGPTFELSFSGPGAPLLRLRGLRHEGRSVMETSTSTELVPVDSVFADVEGLALAGFLAGYRGLTREAYALDLRQFAIWCADHDRRLFDVHRVDIECFGRDLEARGRARATVARRLCTIAGFYRYAEDEGLIEHSPAIHVRRPRLDYESNATGLDRNELGALLVAAGLSSARDHGLVSLLALNGLRVSEALGVDIDALGVERGHRTLTVIRKGGKVVTMPLAPPEAGPILNGRPRPAARLLRMGAVVPTL